jgi:trans-L-3-hydroxyproline dehydratase
MYGCVITPPFGPGSDFGILFLHNEGYSTMCGHGIIGIGTVAPAAGLVPLVEPETVMTIDTPAGQVTAFAEVAEGRVRSVRFRNVPSFVTGLDEVVEVPGIGRVTFDLAFGGAFYAFVRAEDFGLKCLPEEQNRLIETGMAIKEAVAASRPMGHPLEDDLDYLYGTIFIAPPRTAAAVSRNVCIFADGQVDRSPTGTGVSGRMAIHYARGEVGVGEPLVIESIVDTTFTGMVAEPAEFGGLQAVIPEVRGSAHITGRHEFVIDPDDPLKEGFLLG